MIFQNNYCVDQLRSNVHTQFVTQNVKMKFSDQPTYLPLKTSGVTKYFFCCKTSYKGTFGNSNCKRPTNYIMITLFKQARKYYNQNNKILHVASHMALQAAPLIGTIIGTGNRKFLSVSCDYSTTEPSNSLPESSDRYEQL